MAPKKKIYDHDTADWGENQFTHPGGAASDPWYRDVKHKDHLAEKEWAGPMDDLGFFENAPGENIGPDAQYEAARQVAWRNQGLGLQANEALRQGAMNLQSYRPGGSAAMLSPFYQGQAQTLLNMRTEAPDNMFWWRKTQADRARESAERAQMLSTGLQAVTGLGAAALTMGGSAPAMLGGMIGGMAGNAAGSQIGGMAQGQQPSAQDAVAGQFGGGGQTMPSQVGPQQPSGPSNVKPSQVQPGQGAQGGQGAPAPQGMPGEVPGTGGMMPTVGSALGPQIFEQQAAQIYGLPGAAPIVAAAYLGSGGFDGFESMAADRLDAVARL